MTRTLHQVTGTLWRMSTSRSDLDFGNQWSHAMAEGVYAYRYMRYRTMNPVPELMELLRNVVAMGDFGITLRTGETTIVHTSTGPKPFEGVHPCHEEVTAFQHHLTGSRIIREFRDNRVTRFMVPFEGGVRLVGAARSEGDEIHAEIRRMVGDPDLQKNESGST